MYEDFTNSAIDCILYTSVQGEILYITLTESPTTSTVLIPELPHTRIVAHPSI